MKKTFMYIIFNGVFAFIAITFFWFLAYVFVNSKTLSNPFEVYKTIPILIFQSQLYLDIFASLKRVVIGMFFSVIIGVSIGTFMGISKKANLFLNPILYVTYPIPKLALLPIIILLFGLKDFSKVLMIILILVFQIITSIRGTILKIPKENYYYFKILGIGKFKTFFHVTFKYIIKDIFISLKIALGTAISVLFFTENYGTIHGLGYYIMDSFQKADYVNMYSGIVIISFIGFILFSLLDLLEEKFTPWQNL